MTPTDPPESPASGAFVAIDGRDDPRLQGLIGTILNTVIEHQMDAGAVTIDVLDQVHVGSICRDIACVADFVSAEISFPKPGFMTFVMGVRHTRPDGVAWDVRHAQGPYPVDEQAHQLRAAVRRAFSDARIQLETKAASMRETVDRARQAQATAVVAAAPTTN
jgi:hypothetical protein